MVDKYIDDYRASIDRKALQSDEFSFRVFLVKKIGNHEGSVDLAVEFVPFDPADPEALKKYRKIQAIFRPRSVPVINPAKLKPGGVCALVRETLEIPFNPSYHHAKCWKHFGVRPPDDAPDPSVTNQEFCQYDEPHKDYIYTDKWVQLLVDKLGDEVTRREILG